MAIFAIYNKDIFKIILKDIPNQNEIYIVSQYDQIKQQL